METAVATQPADRPSTWFTTDVLGICAGFAIGLGLTAGVVWWRRRGRAHNELVTGVRGTIADLAPGVELTRQLDALEMISPYFDDDADQWRTFKQAGGIEAIVRLFLSLDPALLPIADSTTTTTTTTTTADATTDDEAGPNSVSASASADDTNLDSTAPAADAANESEAKNESESESEGQSGGEKQGETERRQVDEAATADDVAAPPTPSVAPPAATPPRSLVHLLTQSMWVISGSRSPPEDRAKVGTVKVIEQLMTLWESDRIDLPARVCSVAFLASLMRNDAGYKQMVLATRVRSMLCSAFMEATPATDPELLARLTFALNPILGHHSADRSYPIKQMIQKGIVKHTFDLLDYSIRNEGTHEMVVVPLLETMSELAGYADVATCRQILDRPLAANIVRVLVKRLETSNWNLLADTIVTLHALLAERTAPFRPTRQRFQAMFIEAEGEVSEAAGRSTLTGFDVLMDTLTQSIPPLAPYLLATILFLCDDNTAVCEFVRNNDRAMDTLRRFGEPGNPGHSHAQELLLLLSLRHQ